MLVIQSPAKLNLYLEIFKKRKDGYHDLVSLFHRISLSDTLYLQKIPSGFHLKTNSRSLPTNRRNIITRAYDLLQGRFPKIGGVRLRLDKKIPMGAGLGGGSSNAASFLLGMKRLYGLRIGFTELLGLGERLGADVPFFLTQAEQALVWGVGNRLQKMPLKRKYWFLLLFPPQGLSTKKVYHNHILSRRPHSLTKAKGIVKILCTSFNDGDVQVAISLLRNDLERTAFRLRPSIRNIIRKLEDSGAREPRMTGSGATVYSLFSTRKEAEQVKRKLGSHLNSWQLVLCHSL